MQVVRDNKNGPFETIIIFIIISNTNYRVKHLQQLQLHFQVPSLLKEAYSWIKAKFSKDEKPQNSVDRFDYKLSNNLLAIGWKHDIMFRNPLLHVKTVREDPAYCIKIPMEGVIM